MRGVDEVCLLEISGIEEEQGYLLLGSALDFIPVGAYAPKYHMMLQLELVTYPFDYLLPDHFALFGPHPSCLLYYLFNLQLFSLYHLLGVIILQLIHNPCSQTKSTLYTAI